MQENRQNKSPIKQRILLYLEYKGISKYLFYKQTGVTRGVLDQNNGISEENLIKTLENAPDISPNWLLTGKGDMIRTIITPQVTSVKYPRPHSPKGKKPILQDYLPSLEGYSQIPVLSTFNRPVDSYDPILVPATLVGDRIYNCLLVEDDSLSPWIKKDSSIIMNPVPREQWTNLNKASYYILASEGKLYICKVDKMHSSKGILDCIMPGSGIATPDEHRRIKLEGLDNLWSVEFILSKEDRRLAEPSIETRLDDLQVEVETLRGVVGEILKGQK